MPEPVIQVDNLGKKYILGHQAEGYATYKSLRDVVAQQIKAVTKWRPPGLGAQRHRTATREEFWALKEVSFSIQPGERVGIIGRNGAGKSTLLKILSRITEPSTGQIRLRGRVASLLEVGTGFHPELSGRENIFLNGAILGMSRAEIYSKFDEIVAFAEVERFLDTPVKRYSSGMYVRLAFAVAAHLEPEILIIDEVLAVGDAQFQKKCLGKMEDAAEREGKTLLFVSHQMAAVEKLCQKGIVLRQGQVVFIGNQTAAITEYLSSATPESTSLAERRDRMGNGAVRVTGIELRDPEGNHLEVVGAGQMVDIFLSFQAEQVEMTRVIASIQIKTQFDVPVFLQHNRLTQQDLGALPQTGAIVCRIQRLPLPPATYSLTYSLIQDGVFIDALSNAMEISVVDGNFYASSELPPISHGVCLVDAAWRVEG